MLHPSRHAFSLVELSIVLVILGLLVGGILAGQSLIRAAELRAVSTEQQRYITAIQSFRDKYFYLPGDLPNAQSIWGVAHADGPTCVTTASTDARTCNGNGDGITMPSTGSNEAYRFWQHLANAGLLEGRYSGVTDGSSVSSSTTNNSPVSKLPNGLWYVWNWGTQAGDGWSWWANTTYDNGMALGGYVANTAPTTAVLKASELWNIDTKIDDGKPAQGRLVVRGWPSPCTTATANTQTNADYLLSATDMGGCLPVFRKAF